METRIQRILKARQILKQTTPERVYSLNDLGTSTYLSINYSYWLLNILIPFICLDDSYQQFLGYVLYDYQCTEDSIETEKANAIISKAEEIINSNQTKTHWDHLDGLIQGLCRFLYLKNPLQYDPETAKKIQAENKLINDIIFQLEIPDVFKLICNKYEDDKENIAGNFLSWFNAKARLFVGEELPDGFIVPQPKESLDFIEKELSSSTQKLNWQDLKAAINSIESIPEKDDSQQTSSPEDTGPKDDSEEPKPETQKPETQKSETQKSEYQKPEYQKVTMFLKTQMGISFVQEDIEELLQHSKLLFRPEHLNLIDKELLNWEILFEFLSDALNAAIANFNKLAESADLLKYKLDKSFLRKIRNIITSEFIRSVFSATLGRLVSILLVMPTIGISSLGVGTIGSAISNGLPILLTKANKRFSDTTLYQYLDQDKKDITQNDIESLALDSARAMKFIMRQQLNDIRLISIDLLDVPPDIDFQFILDYVYYQNLMNLKIGLDTTSNEYEVSQIENAPYKQQDKKENKSKTPDEWKIFRQSFTGNKIVREARDMLENAFEYQFEFILKKLTMSPELNKYFSRTWISSITRRIELQMWEMWIHKLLEAIKQSGHDGQNTPAGYENIKKRMMLLAEEESKFIRQQPEYYPAINDMSNRSTVAIYYKWLQVHLSQSVDSHQKDRKYNFLDWNHLINPQSILSKDDKRNDYLDLSPFHPVGEEYQKMVKGQDFLFLRN